MANARILQMADAPVSHLCYSMGWMLQCKDGVGTYPGDMENEAMPDHRGPPTPEDNSTGTRGMLCGMIAGVAIGAALGAALQNMAFLGAGIGTGMALELAIGSVMEERSKEKDVHSPGTPRQTCRRGPRAIMRWEYRNLEFRTIPAVGIWSRVSRRGLDTLEKLQSDGWELFQATNVRGYLGFTAQVLLTLRRELEQPEGP